MKSCWLEAYYPAKAHCEKPARRWYDMLFLYMESDVSQFFSKSSIPFSFKVIADSFAPGL